MPMVPSECGLDADWVTNPSDLAEGLLSRQPLQRTPFHLTFRRKHIYLFHSLARLNILVKTLLLNAHRPSSAYTRQEAKLPSQTVARIQSFQLDGTDFLANLCSLVNL